MSLELFITLNWGLGLERKVFYSGEAAGGYIEALHDNCLISTDEYHRLGAEIQVWEENGVGSIEELAGL
jgi:hypothetical protein